MTLSAASLDNLGILDIRDFREILIAEAPIEYKKVVDSKNENVENQSVQLVWAV